MLNRCFCILQTLMSVQNIRHVRTMPPVKTHLAITRALVHLVGQARSAVKVKCLFFLNIEWRNCFFYRNKHTVFYISLDINKCVELQPCGNGVLYFHGLNDYRCVCMPGWTGKTCTAAYRELTTFETTLCVITGDNVFVIVRAEGKLMNILRFR